MPPTDLTSNDQPKTFRAWLLRQVNRTDAIGAIARVVRQEMRECSLRAYGYVGIRQHLVFWHSLPVITLDGDKALEAAYIEWEQTISNRAKE